jgi:hypothetical protein
MSDAPSCQKCTKLMKLNYVIQKGAGLPELRAFRCFSCNEVATLAVGLSVPSFWAGSSPPNR